MATQNPIEQEGTYPLPEAQLDRFLLYVRIGYPDASSERRILRLVRDEARGGERPWAPIPLDRVFDARRAVLDVHLAPELEEYIVQLVVATRNPAPYGEKLAGMVQWGASPRGTLALDRCSRARAWLAGRDFVTPGDIHAIAPDVLRHRVILTYQSESEGVTTDDFVKALVAAVPVP
jgi:MoxR-like ATPase